MAKDPIAAVDSSGLTDMDWAEIDRLADVYERDGEEAFAASLRALAASNPVLYIRVLAAFLPDETRQSITDFMAEQDIGEDELRDIIRKAESPAREQ